MRRTRAAWNGRVTPQSQWSLLTQLNEEQSDRLRSGWWGEVLRIPLQHVTGRMFPLAHAPVGAPGVFIVRPETGSAGLAIDEAGLSCVSAGEARVVDLCTGRAIAFAAALEAACTEVWAVEKEADPFCPQRVETGISSERAERISSVVTPRRSQPVPPNTMVDVAVTNPPYAGGRNADAA